ncbi:MAG: thioredoxin domain-containing protein [Cyclobacteriaceae bacterium]|nr:thioredoxin domain-containing protein [Cyclobacteriaceae bacterium]
MRETLLDIISKSFHINVSKDTRDNNNQNASSSLLLLSDQLNEWSVDNLAVKLQKEQLLEIPYPAIAHLNTNGGTFVVLQKIEANLLYYAYPYIGAISETIEEFDKKWTGVVLLVETSDKSGEQDYKQKHKQEIFEQVSLYVSVLLLSILWALPLFFIMWSGMAIYLLNSVGAVLSFLLFKKQFGLSSVTINSFCKMGAKSDCDAVINSPASKLFGVIHLSELCFWYFAGSVLSIVFGVFSSVSVAPFLFALSMLATGLSFFTVYYQGAVIKKWCPLCLMVTAVLWLEAGVYLLSIPELVINIKSFSVLFVGFSLPLIFWLSVRKRFIDSFKLPSLQRNLNRFLQSERIFQNTLQDQPHIETGLFTHELQTGSPDAPVQLTVVGNPQCGPCAYTHAVLDNLKISLDEKVNIIYRFTVNSGKKGTSAYQVLETVFAIQQTESSESALRALTAWYQSNSNLEGWKKRYEPNREQENPTVTHILKEHEQWCAKVAIQKTPSLIINGRMLPEEFSVNDLKFQLRRLAEKITEPELIS